MANKVREIIAKGQHNLIGTGIGAVAGFLVTKKVIKADKTWKLVVGTLVGAVAGAIISASIKAKKSEPTKETVTKK